MSENGADVSWHDVGKVLEEEISSAEDIQADLVRNNKGNTVSYTHLTLPTT